jgi:hypothetical protein
MTKKHKIELAIQDDLQIREIFKLETKHLI